MNVNQDDIQQILKDYKRITVLGLSPDPSKPSHEVPVYMKSKGYDIVGVYPKEKQIAGITIYQHLKDVPLEYRKFVDVFRRSDRIPEVVDEVLAVGGVEVLWLQLGITNPEAEKRAEAAGLKVVSNRCLLIEHRRYWG
jgi:hypothetical protein